MEAAGIEGQRSGPSACREKLGRDPGCERRNQAPPLEPGDANLRLQYGVVLHLTGRSEPEIPVLKTVTSVDPARRSMHLFQIALCFRRLGRIDEAIAKYRESLLARAKRRVLVEMRFSTQAGDSVAGSA